ncbi:MAG: ABC transporter permease [Rhizobiales bacterium]|nr:ABC transporter permease [Hyphomicrobiales bacterium]MBA70333.1 ABC transporter permease [Hyphomicrobiales bacterium]|tara:strand:- start:267 stop:1220 length:954 start_codon:yes stop_codon:yes gene_type:complete
MEVLETIFNVSLIAAMLRTTTPILLVALGGTFTTKAGIFNIGLEGQMLLGAFFAVLGSLWTQSAWGGVAIGVLAAMCVALTFSFFVVTLRANEVVVGLALNILAGGLTITLTKAIFGTRGSIVSGDIVGLPRLHIPVIEDLGSLGKALGSFTPLIYLAFILVFVVWVIIYRTKLGLYIRVAGEKPAAAEALGIPTGLMQHIASLLCGVLAGLAGAHLSLGYITMFAENMSSGRGFMAVAVLIFSAGDPVKVLFGCLLFGFADALSLRLQTFGLSSYLVLTVPYLVTLGALFLLTYRQRPKIFRETAESLQLIRREKA